MGVKVGPDQKLYRNTGTYGSPVWNEITIVRDLAHNMTKSKASAQSRGSRYNMKKGGGKEVSLDFDILADATVDDYDVLKDAWVDDDVIDTAVADGPIATVGTRYWRADYEVFDFNRGEPLNDVATVAVNMELAYSANAPAWTTVAA